jgi:hypothetical protein
MSGRIISQARCKKQAVKPSGLGALSCSMDLINERISCSVKH